MPDRSSEFTVKDSGKREEFTSGMVRDTTEGKIDFTLIRDGVMFKRWAQHLTNGAKKYFKRNWMKATGQAELDRFRESADRHFAQWMAGDTDEDHASAVYFNINGYETLKARMESPQQPGAELVGPSARELELINKGRQEVFAALDKVRDRDMYILTGYNRSMLNKGYETRTSGQTADRVADALDLLPKPGLVELVDAHGKFAKGVK